ncbi:MAG: DUF4912 domain-containing protein [Candidatus Omnitrophota bacterium]
MVSKFNQGVEFRTKGSFNIPSGYNDNKIVLMVRDPWTIYSYWEISREVKDSTLENIQKEGLVPSKITLRLYDLSEAEKGFRYKAIRDFEVEKWAGDRYINTGGEEKNWMAEIGILCASGKFFCLARSNTVTMPDASTQEIYDEIGYSSLGMRGKRHD